MKNSDKNRDPMKARKRAKNDGTTAARKLAEWAEELGRGDLAHELRAMEKRIPEIGNELASFGDSAQAA